MRIVITGGAGFLGNRLARKLLERGTLTDAKGRVRAIESITLVDVVPAALPGDARVTAIAGDLADKATIEGAVARDTDSVFHLAAVVSGQAEAEFDVGMRYSERQVNGILRRFHPDVASLRRYLVDEGFLDREAAGEYWRAGGTVA